MLLLLLLKCILLPVIQQGLAQSCLQSAKNKSILFDNNFNRGLPSGSQVIVTSYQFQCCGNITVWRAAVRRFNGQGYTIHFQVWRPSPTVESDGCYSLVGENRFTSIMLNNRLVRETPDPTNIISVQPGDVLGYYTQMHNKKNEIALHRALRKERVWYHTSANPQTAVVIGESCPFPVGAGPERTLNSSTNKGPVISASLVTINCTSQSSVTTTHSLLPLPTNYLTMTPHMTPHMTTPPNTASMSVKDTGIIAGVCVSAVLVVTLGILAAAIAIHRRKAEGRREELTQNVAYISTPGIAVEANVCYSSTIVPAPADQDDLYVSI